VKELLQTTRLVIDQVVDLVLALHDFLWMSSISLHAPAFVGITVVALLLGLLLGRMSRPGIQEPFHGSEGEGADRVVLDLDRLTPLGLSAEEEAETEVMDISGLRKEGAIEGTPPGLMDRQQRPEAAPQR